MDEITLCDGDFCPLKYTCLRYLTLADPSYQAYYVEPPYNQTNQNCDYYEKTDMGGLRAIQTML
jgi:hypothetical protein